ncbi:MAG: hypothetical protein R6X34_26115 [Chloroflexota bacterium]
MSMWRDVGDLLEMVSQGGLVIQTGLDGQVVETAVPDPAVYAGKTYPQKGIRTTIQLDSDYITILSPEIMARPEIWQSHMDQVAGKLAVLETLRLWARQSWVVFLLPALVWLLHTLFTLESLAAAWELLLPTLVSALIVFLRKQLKRFLQVFVWPVVMRVVVWVVRRRFQAFVDR